MRGNKIRDLKNTLIAARTVSRIVTSLKPSARVAMEIAAENNSKRDYWQIVAAMNSGDHMLAGPGASYGSKVDSLYATCLKSVYV